MMRLLKDKESVYKYTIYRCKEKKIFFLISILVIHSLISKDFEFTKN